MKNLYERSVSSAYDASQHQPDLVQRSHGEKPGLLVTGWMLAAVAVGLAIWGVALYGLSFLLGG
ncbi:MAG: hypothetical protein AAF899_14495 [Pseudomonadota bacterium]